MMKTPIYDFVRKYAESGTARFHMPGHKGREYLGCEPFDITEIDGADVLGSAAGIIKESEDNATALFGTAHTYYSAQGSTLAIQAMLAIALNGRKSDTPPTVLAARNVHKAFVHAAALLDFEVEWLYSERGDHICSADISAAALDSALVSGSYAAVYITSPDYLGNVADIRALSNVCKRHGVPLLVDNAHGAYLHISQDYAHYTDGARSALSLFASTSPSYLILSSLDLTNRYLASDYPSSLRECIGKIEAIKRDIPIPTMPSEPLKMVFKCTDFGYSGAEFSALLRKSGIECEFSDDTYTVLMITPSNDERDLSRLESTLRSVTPRAPLAVQGAISTPKAERVMSIRSAVFAPHEIITTEHSVGRIAGTPTVSCPPAIPIVISGESITASSVALFKRYGITEIEVVKNA